jgi:hypothetical protein
MMNDVGVGVARPLDVARRRRMMNYEKFDLIIHNLNGVFDAIAKHD